MSQQHKYAVITGGEGNLASVISTELKNASFVVDAPGRAALDVTSSESISDYFNSREVDLLICNAGITRDQPLIKMSESDWDEVWNTNYVGAMRCAESTLEKMKDSGHGHIIFISSFSAISPPIGQTSYAAAKAALIGLTKDLAVRYGSYNIRVNAILPGFLETKMTKNVSQKRRDEVRKLHTLERFNECGEVAKFIRILHDDLPHTSGQVFQLDSRINE